MKYLLPLIFLFCFSNACTKKAAEVTMPPAEEAVYDVKISVRWSSPSFTIPVGAHFSNVVGMIHSTDTAIWQLGKLATRGLEDVAEIGSNQKLEQEMEAIIARQKGMSTFNLPPPAITGDIDTFFLFTINHSAISFASMIAPSPDWFIGIAQANMLQNGQWIKVLKLPIYIYDAGTEDGDVFGYNNPESTPQQLVHLLTPATGSVLANGNIIMAPIGEIVFTKR